MSLFRKRKKDNTHKYPTPEEEDKELVSSYERLWALYKEIWEERPHFSQISKTPLGREIKSIYFDHLLEKNSYPSLKYEKNNIVLVTGEEHKAKSDGFPLPLHQELINIAKTKYEQYGKL